MEKDNPVIEKGKIRSIEKLTDQIFGLEIAVSKKFPKPEPFQFAGILYGDFQLRRPFSFAGYRDGLLRFVIKKSGRMSELLSQAKPGDEVSVLGPLGKSPDLAAYSRILCVAGGVGIAPFLYFFEEEAKQKDISLIYGVRTIDDAWYEDTFTDLKGFLLVTEDGSSNYHGYPVDYVLTIASLFKPEALLAVGPSKMLASLKPLLDQVSFPIFVSLETYMGCSLGACGSCAVKHKEKGYIKVCTQGPVFRLNEIELYEEAQYADKA
jgi:dihydroorotate dehydrogenase electron transfer subunit